MTTLIICIIIYILSVLKNRDFIQKAHYHKEGIWNKLIPSYPDLLFTFIPVSNTIFAIGLLFLSPYKNGSKSNKTKNLAEFIFKPRKYKNETT